jgi:hypothetical protein
MFRRTDRSMTTEAAVFPPVLCIHNYNVAIWKTVDVGD